MNKLTEGKIKQQRIARVLIELRNQYAEARQEEERRQAGASLREKLAYTDTLIALRLSFKNGKLKGKEIH